MSSAKTKSRRWLQSVLRATAGRTPVLQLLDRDGAVALVVEDYGDRMCALAHGGLEFVHGHGEATVTAERHGDPIRITWHLDRSSRAFLIFDL